jgi:hypothetical protein
MMGVFMNLHTKISLKKVNNRLPLMSSFLLKDKVVKLEYERLLESWKITILCNLENFSYNFTNFQNDEEVQSLTLITLPEKVEILFCEKKDCLIFVFV